MHISNSFIPYTDHFCISISFILRLFVFFLLLFHFFESSHSEKFDSLTRKMYGFHDSEDSPIRYYIFGISPRGLHRGTIPDLLPSDPIFYFIVLCFVS